MEKGPKKHRALINRPLKKHKVSKHTISGIIRNMGSGLLKVLMFLSVLTVISLTFVMLYNYLLNSPYMKLAHVEIRGVDETTQNELIQLCGLNVEQGLLNLKLEALKKKMEHHPWVRTATVERHFPHTLIVEVEMEEPVAMVLQDKLYYMNRWGHLFKAVSHTEKMDFPIITGISATESGQGEKLNQAAHVLTVLAPEEDRWSLTNLSEIHLNQNGELALYFNHIQAAINVNWHNLAANMERLKQVAKHLSKSGKINLVTRIDLNHADGAVVSFEKNQV